MTPNSTRPVAQFHVSRSAATSRHDASWWMHRAVAAVPNDHLETGRSRLTSAKAWMCDGVRPFGASACDQFRAPWRSTRAAVITSDHSIPAPQNPVGFTARVGSIPTSGTSPRFAGLSAGAVIRRSNLRPFGPRPTGTIPASRTKSARAGRPFFASCGVITHPSGIVLRHAMCDECATQTEHRPPVF